jgi:transposase
VPDLGRGDVVITSNLSSHKRVSVRKAIEAASARFMFLPSYSPNFNPMEKTSLPPQGHAAQGRDRFVEIAAR